MRTNFTFRTFFILAMLASSALSGNVMAAKSNITFHFYGAQDCGPCLDFKRTHLEKVRKQGAELGFAVKDNMVRYTTDVARNGAYGDSDALLRKATQKRGHAYPPIFFVTKGNEVIATYEGNWKKALSLAKREARKDS